MSLFIALAHAQDAAATSTSAATGFMGNPLILMLVIVGIFYFFLIRPQQKRLKQHSDMVKSLKRGDRVVTGGGIIGVVSKVEDDVLHVEVAPEVKVKITRSSVTELLSRTEPADKAAKKEK